MQDFRQLKVWQKAHRLNLKLYAATASFPKAELFGLCSQIRRAALDDLIEVKRMLAALITKLAPHRRAGADG